LQVVTVSKLLSCAYLAGYARVSYEAIFVAEKEVPVQNSEWAGIFTNTLLAVICTTFAMVAHAIYVCTTARVWLG
jgi:hypothetical protein